MSLNALIIKTLEPLGVPVDFQTYPGDATTYITFFEFNQRSAVTADDVEKRTAHSIQVDIWSLSDYSDLTSSVKMALIENGFVRSMETEMFEEDTGYFHKVLRFNYVQ
ncbi:hypothetical protein [Bacillus infantis]|uniref:DUF3168 domain-containing protein n=1 Tax=Bacillus infantis TaxID=324767 RepID=A0A5D4RK17_9BACI|nr:hypothetical protein [Bacillus infantis]TYS50088.1 hypothetical protein FZD51_05910 [Bacillus infantis]